MSHPHPKIRFKEFNSDWKSSRLGDIAKFSKGKGLSKSDLTENGKTECVRYGELYTHYGETISEVKSRTNVPIKELVLSEANDVIIPASGETQIDIATASCILRGGIALGGDLNIIKTKNNGLFLSYYLNNKRKHDIASLAQGISVVHLYSSQLALLNLNIPTLPEQQKIASFLSSVDEKIQQLTRKKELLEQYKKGVMQQLFSGKLRFKDENGKGYPKWEEKMLGEIVSTMTDYVAAGSFEALRNNVKVYDEPNFAIYVRLTDLRHNLSEGLLKYVDRPSYEFLSKSNLHGGEILIANIGANVGDTYLMPFQRGKATVAPNMIVIRENLQKFYATFLYYNFNSYDGRNLINSAISGSGQPKLSKTDLKKVKIKLPTLDEQKKIADFLSTIDTKIESVANQITQTQTFKKGLLQQMFV